MSWWTHTIFGYDLISELNPGIFVELGTHYGESYFNFCQAVSEQNLRSSCFAVDTWKGDRFTGPYGEEVFHEVSQYNSSSYSRFSRLLRSTFDEATLSFRDGSIDLLHIDGAHDYASVSRDFKTWLPKMGEQGIILFHDIGVRDKDFGVWKLWEEIKRQFKTFEFQYGYGLGVVKADTTTRFKSTFLNFLFECPPQEADSLREYYKNYAETLEISNCPDWARQIKGREENLELHNSVKKQIDQAIYRSGRRTKLDVILQTHANGNSTMGRQRYCGAEKQEVTRRCLISLINSLNNMGPHVDAQLIILDDHSASSALAQWDPILKKAKVPCSFISLEGQGIMNSIRACYEWGLKRSRGDLVYFVQDDYLHSESAIEEMVDSYHRFKWLGGREVGIYPYDDPFRYYAPQNVEKTRVVHGSKRHWRLNFFSPSMFMTSHQVIRENYDLLEAMASSPVGPTMEDDTINNIWQKRGVNLFTPIPSLALHLQFETEQDPFLDWRAWWEKSREI